ALSQAWGWIVYADQSFNVTRSWTIDTGVIPEQMLPKVGYGIYHEHGIVNDTMGALSDPFLSIHFIGRDLKGGTMPLGVFITLVNQVFRSTLKIFEPA